MIAARRADSKCFASASLAGGASDVEAHPPRSASNRTSANAVRGVPGMKLQTRSGKREALAPAHGVEKIGIVFRGTQLVHQKIRSFQFILRVRAATRSEERRVGKECR